MSETCLYLNGLGVSRLMGVARQNGASFGASGSLLTSSSMIFFCFASPSMSDVATDDPGCETWKSPKSVGSTRHSCSCPQTTRSSHEGRYRSLMAFFGVCETRFW